jgi:hypothetical protein
LGKPDESKEILVKVTENNKNMYVFETYLKKRRRVFKVGA